jgi:hypothetical protein
MTRVFVLGNGESRNKVDVNGLYHTGKVYACNAAYRDVANIDGLICVDGGMIHEVYSSDYCSNNKSYFRGWTKLPEMMYSDFVNLDAMMGWGEGLKTENEKGSRTQFVFNGTDPNQIKRHYDMIVKKHNITDEYDQLELRQLMGNHQQWVTWVEDEDCVEQIPVEIEGWSAGPIAVRIAIEKENPTDVFLIGFDMGSNDGMVNNIYKGTSNYVTQDAPETFAGNWIQQHAKNFADFPNVKFWRVTPFPLGTDQTSQFIEEWRDYNNVEYIEQESLHLVLDYNVML